MKEKSVSLFFDRFRPMHSTKEVGQIVLGLEDIGIRSKVITLAKKSLEKFSDIPALKVKHSVEFYSESFWRNEESDTVIFITHFHRIYNRVLESSKKAGKKIIIKADSDGRITFPVPPRVWITFAPYPPYERPKNIARIIKGLITYFKKISDILKQVELADKVMFETPAALENFRRILSFAGRGELSRKATVCPSPVADDIVLSNILRNKENIILAVANWRAYLQKNTREMQKALSLISDMGWQIYIIGAGDLKNPFFVGEKSHKEVGEIMSIAKINFIPSIYESFCLSAAESLCMGCTVVGTPIEVMEFFRFPGPVIISSGFLGKQMAQALKKAMKWEISISDRKEIAKWWRKKLSRRKIAKNIMGIIQS